MHSSAREWSRSDIFFFAKPRQRLFKNSWRAQMYIRDGLWLHSGQLISSPASVMTMILSPSLSESMRPFTYMHSCVTISTFLIDSANTAILVWPKLQHSESVTIQSRLCIPIREIIRHIFIIQNWNTNNGRL